MDNTNSIKLYRGYINDANNGSEDKLESNVNIREKITRFPSFFPSFNPRAKKYANNLLWCTSKKEFAGRVAMSRFFISYCLDDKFRENVDSERRYSPSIVEFSPTSDSEIYIIKKGKVIPNDGLYKDEMLIQKIDKNTVSHWQADPESLNHFLNEINDPKRRGQVGTAMAPFFGFWNKADKKGFPFYYKKELHKDLNTVQLVNEQVKHYQDLGLIEEEIPLETLASNVFQGSEYLPKVVSFSKSSVRAK